MSRPPIMRNWEKLWNCSVLLVTTAIWSRSSGSDKYRSSVIVRMTRPSSRSALYSRLRREWLPRRRSSVTEDRRPLPDRDPGAKQVGPVLLDQAPVDHVVAEQRVDVLVGGFRIRAVEAQIVPVAYPDRKSTRLNSSHLGISYAV